MKTLLLSIFILAGSFSANAQLRQTVYLELLGRNIIGPAIMYEHTYSSERRLNLEYGAGIGYIYSSFNKPRSLVASMPLYIGANLGRTHNKFEFGLTGFIPFGDYRDYEEFPDGSREYQGYVLPFTLYLGYKRYPKEGNGLFFHANLQPLLITAWIPAIPWAGLGVGYSFQKKKK